MLPTASVILYTQKKKATGKYPVKLRVIFNRKHKDFVIGLDLTEDEYSQARKKTPSKNLRNAATLIQNTEAKARTIISRMSLFTFEKFTAEFNGQSKDASDIFPFFEEYIETLRTEGRIKTASSYLTAYNAIKKFNGKKSLPLLDITASFLNRFQDKFISEGRSISTIGIYIRTLRAIYNHCISKGVIKNEDNYPFGRGKYIIPAGKNIKKALTLDEVKKIHDFKPEPGSFQERARDMWLFSYFCSGINFKDMVLLRYKNIDGEMIRFVRQKTKRTSQGDQKIISCHISSKAREILDKWSTGKKDDKEEFVFPILKKGDDPKSVESKVHQFIQNTNKNMKRICKLIGIDKPVTTYYSRHTAATIMKKSGASINQIQEALGHSSPMITQKYLDSFDDDVKKDLANTLTKF